MNAAGTKNQEAALAAETDPKVIESLEGSTVENFIADTMKGGHDINDPELVRTMAEQSSDAIDWLESIGAENVEIETTTYTMAGAEHSGIHVNAEVQGVELCESMTCIKVGKLVYNVTCTAQSEEELANVMALFQAL